MGRSGPGHPREAGGGKTEQGAPAERLDGATAALQTLPGLHFPESWVSMGKTMPSARPKQSAKSMPRTTANQHQVAN